MSVINTKHQMIAEGTVGLRAGRPRQTLGTPNHGQDWSASCRAGIGRIPTNSGVRGTGLFHSSRGASKARDRRRACGPSLPHGSVATQIHAQLVGVRSRNRVSQHFVRQDLDVPECHSLKSFHGVTFHIQEHRMEGVGSDQNHIGENQYERDC